MSGRAAELVALLLLTLKGYRVLARRFSIGAGTGAGEVDVIARRGHTLAFVEVKSRPDLNTAAESIRPDQRRRIARAADAFVAKRPGLRDCQVRFDAILVAPGRWPRHVPNAWRADE
ncbi:MAG: YraN family protein [Rhodospirillales bacterium]|nr:YraN family protein [Rhodospirillales bacterium]